MGQSALLRGRSFAKAGTGAVLAGLIMCAAVVLLLGLPPASQAVGGKPGKPTALEPHGDIASTTPAFTWARAKGAARYELRVYQRDTRLLAKVGVKGLAYRSQAPLPENVDLTWQVRARNARGTGPWSESLDFRVAPDSLKDITSFGFIDPLAKGVVDNEKHEIGLLVPKGTDLTDLVASFTTNGTSVGVFDEIQSSGVTANDFALPVPYTVTARDGSTQDYWVYVFTLGVGDEYQGGIVGYILQTGDPGYAAGEIHGLIAAKADQSAGTVWSTVGGTVGGGSAIRPVGEGKALGTGEANTTRIVNQTATVDGVYVKCTGGAAYLCYHFQEGGYDDWFLPSQAELDKLFVNREAIGGFSGNAYWSSSDNYDVELNSATAAWVQSFASGVQGHHGKFKLFCVRAVRQF